MDEMKETGKLFSRLEEAWLTQFQGWKRMAASSQPASEQVCFPEDFSWAAKPWWSRSVHRTLCTRLWVVTVYSVTT